MAPSLPRDQIEAIFTRLRSQPENKTCFDCQSNKPTWASVPLGIYICLECAGNHRNLGVHLSFVRSTILDTWTAAQIKKMEIGGNKRAQEYFRKHGWADTSKKFVDKYSSRPAALYRQQLENEANGASSSPKSSFSQYTKQSEVDEDFDAEFSDEEVASNSPVQKTKKSVPARSPKVLGSKPSTKFGAKKSGLSSAGGVLGGAAVSKGKKGLVSQKIDDDFDDFDDWDADEPEADPNLTVEDVSQNFATQMNLTKNPSRTVVEKAQPKKKKSEDDWDTFELNTGAVVDTSYASRVQPSAKKAEKKVTSISSDQYFGRDQERQQQMSQQYAGKLSQYSGATSISSAQFFDREESSGGFDSNELSSIGEGITEGVKKISNMANDWFSDFQNRYG